MHSIKFDWNKVIQSLHKEANDYDLDCKQLYFKTKVKTSVQIAEKISCIAPEFT